MHPTDKLDTALNDRAVELLALRDSLDQLDEELRDRKMVLIITPLVGTVLFAPLLAVLFVNQVRLFAVYPATFLATLGAILWAVMVERRRLGEEREAIRDQIRRIENHTDSGRNG